MSLDELKAKLRDVDTREVFVWRAGFEDWKRVEDVSEVMPPRPPQPPPFRSEAHKRKPIPSNTPSVGVAATLAGVAAAVFAFGLAAFGIGLSLDTFAPGLPQSSTKTIANFILGGALGLAFAAYHGAKQYVKRKYSDTEENFGFGVSPRLRSAMGTTWATGTLAYSQPIDRKSEETPPIDLTAHGRPYYAIIDHAVSQLERQESFAREDLYEKARRELFHKLRPDGRWNIQWEWKSCALERAIRKVEAKWARRAADLLHRVQ
jgi:hypothetical protein